jgi:hypothetical protein
MGASMGTDGQEDEAKRSERGIEAMGPKLAKQAAMLLRDDPDADPVGLIAEAGTLEARRCRTSFEQMTGVELEGGGVAVILPKDEIAKMLDHQFPEAARDWLFAGTRGRELRLVICTTNGFRVAAVPIPRSAT